MMALINIHCQINHFAKIKQTVVSIVLIHRVATVLTIMIIRVTNIRQINHFAEILCIFSFTEKFRPIQAAERSSPAAKVSSDDIVVTLRSVNV